MNSYKLYQGGFCDIQGMVIAKDKKAAIEKLTKKLNLYALPVEADEVKLKGYTITITKVGEEVGKDHQSKPRASQ